MFSNFVLLSLGDFCWYSFLLLFLLQGEKTALLGLIFCGVSGKRLRPRWACTFSVGQALQFANPQVHLLVVLGLE